MGYLKLDVPQGSVLGAVLLLIYVNSIFELRLTGKTMAFADDFTLPYHSTDLIDTYSNINSDLNSKLQYGIYC